MSCNCKNPPKGSEEINEKSKLKVVNTILNFILFLIVTPISLIIIIPFVIYIIFKSLVLKDNNLNMMSLYMKMGKKLMTTETDEEGEVELDNDDYEYELMDVEEINSKK